MTKKSVNWYRILKHFVQSCKNTLPHAFHLSPPDFCPRLHSFRRHRERGTSTCDIYVVMRCSEKQRNFKQNLILHDIKVRQICRKAVGTDNAKDVHIIPAGIPEENRINVRTGCRS
jgi:hypothetical protein